MPGLAGAYRQSAGAYTAKGQARPLALQHKPPSPFRLLFPSATSELDSVFGTIVAIGFHRAQPSQSGPVRHSSPHVSGNDGTMQTESNGPLDHHQAASYEMDKAKILARLKRLEGQVRGVHKMV